MTMKLRSMVLASLFVGVAGVAMAQDLPPLNSDEESDRIDWSALAAEFGDIPAPAEDTSIGGVSKTLTNEYWRSLGEGYENVADQFGITIAYQAAPSEGDQLAQLSIAENMILQGFDALLFSPQTDNNLQPALESATAQDIPVVNVNDAVIPSVAHYVGNVQRDNGVRVAQWFIDNTEGGKLAVIEGQPGVFAAGQRRALMLSPAFRPIGAAKRPTTLPRRYCSSTPISLGFTPITMEWRSVWSKRFELQGLRARSQCLARMAFLMPMTQSAMAGSPGLSTAFRC